MRRPPEHLKSLAHRLAQQALSPDGRRLLHLLHQAGMLPTGPAADAQPDCSPGPKQLGRIGIWEPRRIDGRLSYVRAPDAAADWPQWANIARIQPKHTRWRVLLLGESVTRGWLYEPYYTPGMVLQALLERHLGTGSVEVIDLARTDMATEIQDLAVKASALEPDAIVVFAGNNWRPPDPTAESRRAEVESVLRTAGVPGLKRLAEDDVSQLARTAVGKVRDFYTARQTPVVWVVPEFNLGDWKDWRINAPHLRGHANAEWLSCCQAADAALAEERFQAARELALRMLALDGASNSHTFAVLAACSLQAGDLQSARGYLEQARDARIWDWSQSLTPRCLAVVRRQIRQHGQHGTSLVVDLPEVFHEHLQGTLPDRRLFLDYCHLTVEGIRVSMAAVAARLLELFTQQHAAWQPLVAQAPAPTAAVEAEGSLLGAVHCAHWFQAQPLVEHYCKQALERSPHTAEIMMRLIELQTTVTPALLSRPAEQLSRMSGQAAQYLLGRYNIQQLDAVLLKSMATALECIGQSGHRVLRKHWLAGHDVSDRPVDLLDFYYLSAAGQPQELFWAMPPERRLRQLATTDYYRAHWIDSTFVFVARAQRPVRLEITCRIPDMEGAAETFGVYLNGQPIVECPADSVWRAHVIRAPAEAVREGLNALCVRWPERNGDQGRKLVYAADQLASRPLLPLFQVFGEIHSFTASAAA